MNLLFGKIGFGQNIYKGRRRPAKEKKKTASQVVACKPIDNSVWQHINCTVHLLFQNFQNCYSSFSGLAD